MAECQQQVPRWDYYQILAIPEERPFSVAQREAAEVEADLGTAAKTDWVVDVATVADPGVQIGCHVAIGFDRAPVLSSVDDVEALQDASHSACLCYSCWVIVQTHGASASARHSSSLATGQTVCRCSTHMPVHNLGLADSATLRC